MFFFNIVNYTLLKKIIYVSVVKFPFRIRFPDSQEVPSSNLDRRDILHNIFFVIKSETVRSPLIQENVCKMTWIILLSSKNPV